MNIALLNGSPKAGAGNSAWFLERLEGLFTQTHAIARYHVIKKPLVEEDFQVLRRMDAIVLAFPLYIDAIPSHLFRMMVDLEQNSPPNSEKETAVYVVANNGFFEGKQNHVALEIVRNWCARAGLRYGQGVGQGAGEMIGAVRNIPLGHGPMKNTGNALQTLARNIEARVGDANLLFSPNFPRIAWHLSANSFWHGLAKKNGVTRRDIKRRGV